MMCSLNAVQYGYEGKVYGYGFSYVYSRQAALDRPFPHISQSEDNQFMARLRQELGDARIGLMPDSDGICLHLLHGGDSSGANLTAMCRAWRLRALLCADFLWLSQALTPRVCTPL